MRGRQRAIRWRLLKAMAMLAVPTPRPKPQQAQQVLREPPPEVMQAAGDDGMSPESLRKRKEMADALIAGGADYSPVESWTQGLARVAQALSGNYTRHWLDKQEAEKRSAASGAWSEAASDADPKSRMAKLIALADNPWLGEGARSVMGPMIARDMPQPKTDDQREYDAAVQGGFQGSFFDYMKALKTPVMQPPQGYVMAPDSTPENPRVVRMEGLPADPAAAPKPAVQAAEDSDVEAMQGLQSMNAQLAGIEDQISGGKLDLGFWNNLAARGQNFVGASSENSINYATMMSTLEKMRNESLRLNKGVQTEGDAVRAWNELVANVNDPKVVQAQIKRIRELNDRAIGQRRQLIDIRRGRNNMEQFDPASVSLPGAAPTAPPGSPPEQFAPTDGPGAMPAAPVAPASPAASPTGAPKAGDVIDGYKFKGGNPADQANWEPAGSGGPLMETAPVDPDPYGLMDLTNKREALNAKHKRMLTRP